MSVKCKWWAPHKKGYKLQDVCDFIVKESCRDPFALLVYVRCVLILCISFFSFSSNGSSIRNSQSKFHVNLFSYPADFVLLLLTIDQYSSSHKYILIFSLHHLFLSLLNRYCDFNIVTNLLLPSLESPPPPQPNGQQDDGLPPKSIEDTQVEKKTAFVPHL